LSDNVIKFPKQNIREIDPDDLPDRWFDEARYRVSLLEANNVIRDKIDTAQVPFDVGETERSLNYWALELLRQDPQRLIDWTYEQMYFIQDASIPVEDDYEEDLDT